MTRRLALLLPLLAACDKSIGTKDPAEEPLADLGEPFAAIYAHTAPGYLRSECQLGVDLYEEAGSTAVASAEIYAQGGEWVGVPLETEVQYVAEASWQDCTTVDSTGTGTFSSGVFSGVEGDIFVFRYDGVTAAFENVVQREDFEGGKALITFIDTATSADVAELAEEYSVSAELLSTTSKQYEITWEDRRSVAEVLSTFSDRTLYLDGEPVWIEAPDWWEGG